ncbi:hypothetical protein JCM10914A_20780 [Paenibacillus sp. JCM 10914]|uniref:hypothetical protein n=1 Tax=Paenibacillus sp. JCM 10914 TaxID=1236974 RepID=UPI0003CC5868|nr:hypothetical protein [Paenibacillus sp. JCM 10914]GAE09297.1 hypothetical protein JCM10914_5653 [Paenibacillus sp. JCM 10914]
MARRNVAFGVGISVVLIILLTFISFSLRSDQPMSGEQKIAANYVEARGYKIVSSPSEPFTYTLEKALLNPDNGQLPYIQIWGVQSIDPAAYFGKEITSHSFIVSGHPLDAMYGTHTALQVMMAEGKVIGGTSFPDRDDLAGAPYALDGRTLEDVIGISFSEWRKQWAEKYDE